MFGWLQYPFPEATSCSLKWRLVVSNFLELLCLLQKNVDVISNSGSIEYVLLIFQSSSSKVRLNCLTYFSIINDSSDFTDVTFFFLLV